MDNTDINNLIRLFNQGSVIANQVIASDNYDVVQPLLDEYDNNFSQIKIILDQYIGNELSQGNSDDEKKERNALVSKFLAQHELMCTHVGSIHTNTSDSLKLTRKSNHAYKGYSDVFTLLDQQFVDREG